MVALGKTCLAGTACILGLVLVGCTTHGTVSGKPSWWDDPRPHDKEHLYFKAKGESPVSEQVARDTAMESVRRQLADYILSENDPDGSLSDVARQFDLREVESYKENTWQTATGRWILYLLARYPRSEYDRIRQRIELADALQRGWAMAQSEINRGETAKAEKRMRAIIRNYDQSLAPGFALEKVKLTLAGLYLKQTPPSVLEARKWILDIRKSTGNAGWRQQAEEMERNLPAITLYDAFKDRKVGLFCCVRDGNPVRTSPELLAEATARLTASGVQVVKLEPKNVALAARLFDGGSLAPLAAEARSAGAQAILALQVVVDPAKTGRMEQLLDCEREMLDASVSYQVIRALDGRVVVSGNTPGWSYMGAKSLLKPVFGHRDHLPGHTAAIAEAMDHISSATD